MARKGVINVATCQFGITANVKRNAGIIRRQIRQAAERGADLVHFPETALTGYPTGRSGFNGFDWDLILEETRSIMALAGRAKVWVALGSAHRLSGKRLPYNCVHVINSRGRIVERYDKCFGTGGDLRHFSSGSHFSTFVINVVRCGIIICYDIWFIELCRRYKKLGVDCLLHSIYSNAKDFSDRTDKRCLMDFSFNITNARINRFWVSAANYADRYQDTSSYFVDPDGEVRTLPFKRAGVQVNRVDLHGKFWDASAAYRDLALAGKFGNGKPFRDPRSGRTNLPG